MNDTSDDGPRFQLPITGMEPVHILMNQMLNKSLKMVLTEYEMLFYEEACRMMQAETKMKRLMMEKMIRENIREMEGD